MRAVIALLLALAALLSIRLGEPTARAQPSPGPDPAQLDVEVVPLVTGLNNVVGVYQTSDDDERLLVVEKRGLIHVLRDGEIEPLPFLDITDSVNTSNSSNDERGLLGLAFPPDYEESGVFYADYVGTGRGGDTTYVSRFAVSDNPDIALAESEERLLEVSQPFRNHNGGQIAFGPDGFLYIAMGDGGGSGDPEGNGQKMSTLLGKILRIRVDSEGDYGVPGTNPFAGETRVAQEIWAYGLRNPWRFSFDRSTGDLYIADVGQGTIEEINHQPAESPGGENYGWNIMEGSNCFPPTTRNCNRQGLVLPVAEYDHTGGNCSVTGGYVYRGSGYPALQGAYLYADYCSRRIWALSADEDGDWRSAIVGSVPFQPATFGEDVAGEMYVAGGGTVGRVVLEDAPTPTATDADPTEPSESPTVTPTSDSATATNTPEASETPSSPTPATTVATGTRVPSGSATPTLTETAPEHLAFMPLVLNRYP